MKHYFITITLALLLGYSCRTVKERSETQQRYEATEQRQFTVQWNHYDSTGLYWHFQSDSLFYYHPDRGLYGWGGRLTVEEELVQRNLWQSHNDSVGYRLEQRSVESYTSEPSSYRSIWKYAVAIGLIFILVGLYERYRPRT